MENRSRATAVLAVLLLAFGAGACASGGGSGSSGSSVLSSTRLTADDLSGASYATVYDFLKAHSRVQIRARRGLETLVAYRRRATMYIDGREVRNPVNVIQQLPLGQVQSLEILRPSEAGMAYGGEGRASAIVIATRERGGG